MIKESRPANECRPSVGEAALESFSKQEAHALPLVARLNGAHHPFSLSLPPQTTTRRFEAVQTTTSDLGLLLSYFLSAWGRSTPIRGHPRLKVFALQPASCTTSQAGSSLTTSRNHCWDPVASEKL